MHVEGWADTGWPVLQRSSPTLLVLGRPTCDDCQRWHAALTQWRTGVAGVRIVELNLRSPEGKLFKADQPWTQHIDWVPYNLLYVNGETVAEWSGESLDALEEALVSRA